jgi:hypothetical protein
LSFSALNLVNMVFRMVCNKSNSCWWTQLDPKKTKSEDWMPYFLCAHRSNASAEYKTRRNYLDRWSSKMSTTTSLTVWNAWERLNGYDPMKCENQILRLTYV